MQSGKPPALTAAERAEVSAQRERRRQLKHELGNKREAINVLRREIDELRLQLSLIPRDVTLAERLGVSVDVVKTSARLYKNPHPRDVEAATKL
jgi:hypothetical protein